MKLSVLLCLFLSMLSLESAAQSIAFSFDDGLDPTREPRASQWNASILDSLSKNKVNSIFYVTGGQVASPEGLSLVEKWGIAGHSIANHTYSHLNLGSSKTSLKAFVSDVQKNQELLRKMPGWIKRFRFPYLKEGNTEKKRDGVREWLADHGYASGAVSIDASDWYYNQRYLAWLKDNVKKDPSIFRDAYLKHIWDRASYYDSLSKKVLERSPKHVLLLHTNAINAAFLSDIINMFRSKGWNVISPEDAYSDPLYFKKIDILPAGESILWAQAKQKNIVGLRYPAEDSVYEKDGLDKLGL